MPVARGTRAALGTTTRLGSTQAEEQDARAHGRHPWGRVEGKEHEIMGSGMQGRTATAWLPPLSRLLVLRGRVRGDAGRPASSQALKGQRGSPGPSGAHAALPHNGGGGHGVAHGQSAHSDERLRAEHHLHVAVEWSGVRRSGWVGAWAHSVHGGLQITAGRKAADGPGPSSPGHAAQAGQAAAPPPLHFHLGNPQAAGAL